jgi:2-polyprenyl-3-methyl-5-hydroxy-6-metoxy-1,4-benzoquinol methylase
VIEVWSDGARATNEGMPAEILTRLGRSVREHPWWKARAALATRWLGRLGIEPPASVLDAGCGWGTTLEALEDRGYRAVGMDVCRGVLEGLAGDRPGRRLIEWDLETGSPAPESAAFDAAVALDVIEHIDDDAAAIARMARLVRPGGVLIVSVPAGPELYGEFDEIQGHRRRYTAERLRRVFEGTELEVEALAGWGRCLLPAARSRRRATKTRPGEAVWETYEKYLQVPRGGAGRLLRALLDLESTATMRGWRGAGTSLIAVARRMGDRPCPAYRPQAASWSQEAA